MIMHIVMWKFKDANKRRNMDIFKKTLLSLIPVIKEIKHMEVGEEMSPGQGNYDMVLVSEFASVEDLKKYNEHPEHLELLKFGKAVIIEGTCVDYEI